MSNDSKQEVRSPADVVFFIVAWLWAGVPLVWGVMQTIHKASALFQ
jgi:hypothetical protein